MADIADVIKKLDQQDGRLERIETAIGAIATQSVQISNLQTQVESLWRKYDAACGVDGAVSQIREHQASCPRPQLPRIWWAIGLLWTTLLGVVWKVAAK